MFHQVKFFASMKLKNVYVDEEMSHEHRVGRKWVKFQFWVLVKFWHELIMRKTTEQVGSNQMSSPILLQTHANECDAVNLWYAKWLQTTIF